MGRLNKIIKEIQRHKGVLMDDEIELVDFSKQLFYGACAQIGVQQQDVDHLVEGFVINKYQQVLEATKHFYWNNPEATEFCYKPKWSALEELQKELAQRYMRGIQNGGKEN